MGSRWYKLFKYLLLLSGINIVWGQSDNVYLDMSLEELFDVDVLVSASKRPEDLFEAPLSVTVIKQEEILRSGATCIPEALRLAPGLIVREQTPGNFDVHIRGFDDVTTSFHTPLPINSIILVMIDNRVVYNYFSGGTFWETLPIGINDIEKIEVVRGPASALYGPNACAGVINIITHFAETPGVSVFANVAAGNDNSKISNLSLGYSGQNMAIGISGNYKTQNRRDDLYYAWLEKEYIPVKDMSTLMFWGFNPETGKPWKLYESNMNPHFDIDRSLDKYGLNSYFSYFFSDQFSINANAGFQESMSQKPYYNNFSTPLSEYNSKSYYGDLITKYKGFYTQVSFLTGKHDNNFYWNAYDFDHFDFIAEYQFHIKNLYIRPGLSYRKSNYSGLLIDNEGFGESFNQEPQDVQTIGSTGLSLLADYSLANQWRLIAGIRVDDYSINNTKSLTYEAATTYRLNKNNLFRFVFSKANRAPFMLDSFIGKDVSVLTWIGDYSTGFPILLKFEGNQDIDFLSNHNLEFGWRSKFNSKFEMDVQVFGSLLDDFLETPTTNVGIDTIVDYSNNKEAVISQSIKYENVDYKNALQYGLEYSLSYKPRKDWLFKLYGVIQKTDLLWNRDELKEYMLEDVRLLSSLSDFDNYISIDLDSVLDYQTRDVSGSTPMWYGGFLINYYPDSRFKSSFNGYYSGYQTYWGVSIDDEYSIKIDPFWILNAKFSYRLWNNLSVYVNMRNIIGKHREYGFADYIYNTYLFGFEMVP